MKPLSILYRAFPIKALIPLLIILGNAKDLAAQEERKNYIATRIFTAPRLDGVLDDKVWEEVPVAGDFVMFKPGDGTLSRTTHPTEVKVVYDDEALYIGAYLLDNDPSRIQREFAQRDNVPAADYFVVDLNTYNDGENQTRFIITAAGTLADAKMKGVNEDYNYNVVWEAKVHFDSKGWYAELKIPFSALRFSDHREQVWGMQFGREISHLNEIYVWNYVDKAIGNFSHYNGILRGVENINPPVRLSFYPYILGEIRSIEKNENTALSAGMDFKYGINDAFTFDATLVPNFGQTAYDEVELNLGPFEQTFGENRAFFTEGTELFNKGNLFYSRRIGDTPTGFVLVPSQLKDDEIIVANPEVTNLLNAFKISGRTETGLGVGLFNAVTETTSAIIKNEVTGETRKLVTEPLSNYNILVLDQQIFEKSSLSIINTNVTRDGHFRDGNVTGFLFDVYNKSSSFNFVGEAKMSNINYADHNLTGFASTISVLRTKGKFRYGITHDFANKTYDINDLGLSQTINFNNLFWSTSYRIFEPAGIFSQYNIRLYGNHQRRYQPSKAVRTGIGASFSGTTRERFSFGGFLDLNSKYRDYFESRREGRFMTYQPNYIGDVWISSDYRKRVGIDARVGYSHFFGVSHEKTTATLSPRFRFSNKFSLVYSLEYLKENDRKSFVALGPSQVIFGNRDLESIENAIQGNYNFTRNSAIKVSFRNFWSVANFEDDIFYKLNENGGLSPFANQEVEEDPDANFNIWNLDLSYQWRFAPGSEMILLYRNSLFNLDDRSDLNYLESLNELFLKPVAHTFSMKVVYYLDFNSLKGYL